MFYSQTFLGRKGPLGTVWCAAHLQHRLKKSHYTATDIPSTVDRIMFPEVPIALRMSGHLLLGVVRIYSKKVEYLFHDCNIVLISLRKVFTSTQVNLPEDARQAPVQAITLPETLDLDAMELDADVYIEGISDNHLRSPDDITLTDQIPIGKDPYIAITFDEDIMMDASPSRALHESGSKQTNDDHNDPLDNDHVDFRDSAPEDLQLPSASAAFQDQGPSNQTGVHGAAEDLENLGPSTWTQVFESNGHENSQDCPEIETMRDFHHDSNIKNPESSDKMLDPTEEIGSLEQVLNEKIHTPKLSTPFQQHLDPPTSASDRPQEEVPFVHESPQLVIQPSPPMQQQRQRRMPRRKQFDEKVVLTNRLMKRALEDTSDIVKKRRKIPCSALGVWKLNNSKRMEHIFNEPSLTGLCPNICTMFEKDYISTKSQCIVPEEVAQEPTVPEYTAPATVATSELRNGTSLSDPTVGLFSEIERLRHNESSAVDNVFPEIESFAAGSMASFRRDDSPFSANSLESEFASKAGAASVTDIATSTKTYVSDFYTPRTLLEESTSLGNTGFSSIPEYGSYEGQEDLYFLAEDNNTPTESQASQGVDSLSVRTRSVAKYLKRLSPISSISEDAHGGLSLNKILEGKTRKICARMFFETLVLKNYELVDVEQEQPYGDITLKLTPTLAKAEI